jgi:hypothetical protein
MPQVSIYSCLLCTDNRTKSATEFVLGKFFQEKRCNLLDAPLCAQAPGVPIHNTFFFVTYKWAQLAGGSH